jgi:hypothetical protein
MMALLTVLLCFNVCISVAVLLQVQQCGQVMLHLQPPQRDADGADAGADCV